MFQKDFNKVQYAWLTVSLVDGAVSCAAGPEQWKKRGHHATWFPEGDKISMNLKIDGDIMRFVQVNYDGGELKKMHDLIAGSGHPTVYPGGSYIVTDSYLHESMAFEDGTVPVRWVDLKEGKEIVIIRINIKQPAADGVLRVDPHPAWDRNWRYIVFNGFSQGTRKVFIADMSRLIS